MTKLLPKDILLYGFLLWLFGFILSILLFPFVPAHLLGWVIAPFGTLLTLWVLFKKIPSRDFKYYLKISVVWTLLAVFFDYFFLVRLFNPADGYYKPAVYFYYLVTLLLPLLVYGYKKRTM